MKRWEIQIRIFDDDLRKRMNKIRHHEITGEDLEEVQAVCILKAMGFPNRNKGPTVRDFFDRKIWEKEYYQIHKADYARRQIERKARLKKGKLDALEASK